VALGAGVAAALVGLVAPPVRVLYDYAWFVGFAVAFVVYAVLMRGTPPVDLSAVPEVGRPSGGGTRAVAGDRLAEGAAQ
jgi:NCS1 family nucleobase:cation symporter-1